VLFQLCLGAHCFGLPFGEEFKDGKWGRIMKTFCAHIDWSTYTLPPPADSSVESVGTCLVVLTLFPAFPELDCVPAQNRGGKTWATTNTVSPIEVADVPEWGFDICAATIEEQILLRAKLQTLLPHYVFRTDVQSLSTTTSLRRRAASGTRNAAAAARDALL
jgi:hypothetical protein